MNDAELRAANTAELDRMHRRNAERLGRMPINARQLSHDETPSSTGMTMRQHYAGLAMAALINADIACVDSDEQSYSVEAEACAHFAVMHADALIRELAK